MFIDVEKHGVLQKAGLAEPFILMLTSNSVETFLEAVRAMGRPVVLDWGFPPSRLPIVANLKEAGVEVWWFDGDRDAARESFIKRNTVPVEALNVQMPAIEGAWPEIRAVFEGHIIENVHAGPTYEPHDKVYERMFST